MRSLVIFMIGVGSMVATWLTFALVFSDDGPFGDIIGNPTPLIPALAVVAGALAAFVDRRPRGFATVLVGACVTVVALAGWLRLKDGPEADWVQLGVIGIGFAVLMLAAGFVPMALAGWQVDRLGKER
jgi:peptidoglycan/LPS O-acetylase OafA/YrhL